MHRHYTIPIIYGTSAITFSTFGWKDLGLGFRIRFGAQSAKALYIDMQIGPIHISFFYWAPL